MRNQVAAILVLLTGCSGHPRLEPPVDECLMGQARDWNRLSDVPLDFEELRSLATTKFAEAPEQYEERWYKSGEELLYCRWHDWCVSGSYPVLTDSWVKRINA